MLAYIADPVCNVVQHCTCPGGYTIVCPGNGTAPACVRTNRVPHKVDASRLTRIAVSTGVIMIVMLIMSGQLGTKLCRLCFGADMHLGMPPLWALLTC